MHGMIAASVASEQCRRLAAEGLTRMHVYALNRAELPLAIRASPGRARGAGGGMSDFLAFARRHVVLLDGAMGSQLQARELTLDDFWGQENCSEILNLSRPDLIREIHAGYLAAGADAVETNSFGGSPITLGEFGLEDRALEINERAARLAREAVDALSGRRPRALRHRRHRPRHQAAEPRPHRLPRARGGLRGPGRGPDRRRCRRAPDRDLPGPAADQGRRQRLPPRLRPPRPRAAADGAGHHRDHRHHAGRHRHRRRDHHRRRAGRAGHGPQLRHRPQGDGRACPPSRRRPGAA